MQRWKVRYFLHGFKPFTAITIVAVHAVGIYAGYRIFTTGYSWQAWTMMVLMWAINILGITVAYHRHMTHEAFLCSLNTEKFLYGMAAVGFQGDGAWWGRGHWRHHVFTDVVGDPHRPTEFGGGVIGFLWSHVLWLFFESAAAPMGYVEPRRFRDSPGLRWQKAWYWPLALSGFVIPWVFAEWDGVLLAGFFRLMMCWNLAWGVNSFCHVIGDRPHDSSGRCLESKEARNFPLWCLFWILALLSGGEYWHGNHHARQTSALFGWRKWEIDPGGWVVKIGRRAGLFSEVITPQV